MCRQSLQVPCPCPAGGFVNTDFPPDSHPHIGAITGRGWEEGRYLGPRKGGSVGLFFVFSPNAKMTQYYKTATTRVHCVPGPVLR